MKNGVGVDCESSVGSVEKPLIMHEDTLFLLGIRGSSFSSALVCDWPQSEPE
jgi:hypothetical protein